MLRQEKYDLKHPVYGLTGGIASGKSTALTTFQKLGIETLDTDELARVVIATGSPGRQELEKIIGSQFFESGVLNRPRLKEEIYNNPHLKENVEHVIHPRIHAEVSHWLSQSSKSPYRIMCSPLLLETDQHKALDGVIVVDVLETTQETRGATRDAESVDQVRKIIQTQLSRKERLSHADFIIDNSKDVESLYAQIFELHEQLINGR